VPSHSSILSKIEALVNMLEKNCISQGSTILRDSRNLVARLKLLKGVTLLTRIYTGNVKTIYTNINADLARNAFQKALQQSGYLNKEIQQTAVRLLNISNKYNFFTYKGTVYHQLKGLIMGVHYLPLIANLFTAKFEKNLGKIIMLYGRFIDDIIIITNSTKKKIAINITNIKVPGLEIE